MARRLIVSSGIDSNRVTNLIGCKSTGDAENGVFVKVPINEVMPWQSRLLEWTRWIMPTSKPDESRQNVIQSSKETEKIESPPNSSAKGGSQDRSEAASQRPSPDDEPKAAKHPKIPKDHPLYVEWSDEFWTESSALMGNVLHSQPDTTSSPVKGFPTTPLSYDTIRSFSTSVPNLSQVLATAQGVNLEPIESVIMRFQPNPFWIPQNSTVPVGSQAFSAFPPIEMRFGVVPDTKRLELKDVRAIISTENSDLMLPDSPVDIRFQQKTTVRLHGLRDSRLPGLEKFLLKSNLNIDFSKGSRLDMPPTLKLPISSHLCSKGAFELLHDKDALVKNVEYLFIGIEIRKTIAMDFDGWRLVYTSVEAGKAGGRRGELRLRPVRRTASEDPNDDTEQAFISTALKLADAHYTPIEVRKIMLENIRMVPTHGPRPVGRLFKYFARRPIIRIEEERNPDADAEEVSSEKADEDDDKKEYEEDRYAR